MRLLFAGSPDVAVPSLDALAAGEHDVVAVLTRPDTVAGRGRKIKRSEVGARADALGIPVLTPRTLRDDAVLAELSALKVDLAVVVAYGALIPQKALDIPRYGWINLHFSLLPRWRGAAPVQHAVAAGDLNTGVSTFRIEAGLDTGPTFAMVSSPLGAAETAGDILARLSSDGVPVLIDTVDRIAAGTATAIPQPDDGVTLAPKITVADAQVDFSRSGVEVDRFIRSRTPAPGAWTTVGGVRCKLGPVTFSTGGPMPVGHLRVGKRSVEVGTADVPVLLGEIVPQGKRPMPAADYARGARWTDETEVTYV